MKRPTLCAVLLAIYQNQHGHRLDSTRNAISMMAGVLFFIVCNINVVAQMIKHILQEEPKVLRDQ